MNLVHIDAINPLSVANFQISLEAEACLQQRGSGWHTNELIVKIIIILLI